MTIDRVSEATRRRFGDLCKSESLTLFDYNQLDERLRGLYVTPQDAAYEMTAAFCKQFGSESQRSRVVIEYTNDACFQAYAWSGEAGHAVMLTAAVPALLQAAFQNLTEHTNPFSLGGGSAGPVEEPAAYLFPLTITEYLEGEVLDGASAIVTDTVPKHRWQRLLATRFAQLATVFCFAHELSHIVLGHTRVHSARAPRPLLAIRDEQLPREVGSPVSQAWEIQADQEAFAFLYCYVINSPNVRRKLAKHLCCPNGPMQTLQLAARMVYALSILFFMMGQLHGQTLDPGSHPSALVRITYLIAFAQDLLARPVHGYSEPQVSEALRAAHDQAERAWEHLGFTFGLDNFASTIDDLPAAVDRIQRTRSLVDRYLRRYRWMAAPLG